MDMTDAQRLNTPAPRTDADWLAAHWMPFTGNRDFKANPRLMTSAQGCYYRDADGREIFDGLSGLWCCGLGHGRQELTDAVSRQMATLDYSPAFQFGHPLSFELANRIVGFMPAGLNRVFFTGSGSEAADTALKMARAYWRTKGQASKTRLIGREKGYHGVNFGGISVGGMVGNRKHFGQSVEADHLPHTQLKKNAFSRGLLSDSDETVRLTAMKVLSSGQYSAGFTVWAPFVSADDFHDRSPAEKRAVYLALKQTAADEAVPYWQGLLTEWSWTNRKKKEELALLAADILGKLATPAAVAALEIGQKKGGAAVRQACTSALSVANRQHRQSIPSAANS